jgi:hypothetical protein
MEKKLIQLQLILIILFSITHIVYAGQVKGTINVRATVIVSCAVDNNTVNCSDKSKPQVKIEGNKIVINF